MIGSRISFRARLIMAAVLVELVVVGALMTVTLRTANHGLFAQTEQRIKELDILFNAALAAPLAQRDYATLGEMLQEIKQSRGLDYLVLTDLSGTVVASAGWSAGNPLPEPITELSENEFDDGKADLRLPIFLAGQHYGNLSFGVATPILQETRQHLVRQGLAIAAVALPVAIALLSLAGFWLTRQLVVLTEASERVAKGEFDIHLPIRSADEFGQLTGAFNLMAEAVLERVGALVESRAELARSEREQRRYAESAEQERARLVALLSAMNLGILFVGKDGRVVYHNPAFVRIWTIEDKGQLIGMTAPQVLAQSSSILSRPDHFSHHLLSVLETREVSDSFEIHMADGRVVTQLNYPVRDKNNHFIGHLWIYEDVTNERQTAEQLVYLAERDSLTGLCNRHRFQQELNRMVDECARIDVTGALLFFDLDEFKVINDNFGHRAGDALLIRVAGEVNALVRRNEIFARLGGDEFALLVANTTEEEVSQLADRIVRAVSQIPFRFEGQNLRLTASLGIALCPAHATETDALVAHADAAMYQAKEAGKNTWRVYRADLDTSKSMAARLGWNQRIANALENGLFQLHFQGVFKTHNREFSHLEALVRMVDEANPGEFIMPGRFIPVAEKSGKILNIDRWVLAESVRLLRKHPSLNSLAVNISGRSFDDPSLPQYISDLLREAEVEPKRLMVELTETSAVSDLADAQRFIEALRVTGCGVCLDDFGSGFASFAYLKHLAVDTVKIDGLFIRNLPHDRDNQIFVKAIVDVARGMGKRTVAEFVENEETFDMLSTLGVDMVQGYFLDMPQANHPALG